MADAAIRERKQAELRLTMLERQVSDLTTAVDVLSHKLLTYGTRLADTPPQAFDISPDDVSSLALGFKERQFDAASLPFRALDGGEAFEIRTFLDRSVAYTVELRLKPVPDQPLGPLLAYADYAKIATDTAVDSEILRIRSTVPADRLNNRVVLTYQRLDWSDDPAAPNPLFYGVSLTPLPVAKAG